MRENGELAQRINVDPDDRRRRAVAVRVLAHRCAAFARCRCACARRRASAHALAEFLAEHPKVEAVHYPGLASHPAHAIARRQMSGFGGMLSVQAGANREESIAIASRLRLFTQATSLGGTESLIEHRASVEGPGTRAPENLLRVSVGLEHIDDLKEDFDAALARLMSNAVLLLSGGLDSTTLLAHALREGFDVHAMTFRYGQRHATEIDAARRVAAAFGVRDHVIVDIDLRTFGGSALTSDIAVPKDRDVERDAGTGFRSRTCRRATRSFSRSRSRGPRCSSASDIFIGVNALDYSGYPDCRPEYIAAFERMANLATRGGVEGTNPIRIRTPLIDLTKAQIIRRGLELGVDYSMTQSCYDPDPTGAACGHCDACQLRSRVCRGGRERSAHAA